MERAEIEKMIASTFDDRYLSRGERLAVRQVVEELRGDPGAVAYARSVAFRLVKNCDARGHSRRVLDWLEDIVEVLYSPPLGEESESCFARQGQDECLDAVTRRIRDSRQRIDACVFTITDDRLARELKEAHRRGVRIRVITDNEKRHDVGSDAEWLSREGILTRVDESEHHMHHKFAIVDGRYLITGSYNWTRSASDNNFENVLITTDDAAVEAFEAEFELLWQKMIPLTSRGVKTFRGV